MRTVIAMPAWNEGAGIISFITEMNLHFSNYSPIFIVVNDNSTDNTLEKLDELSKIKGISLFVYSNLKNLGHGPSTLRALKIALKHDPTLIIAVDGDGQFSGEDIFKNAKSFIASEFQIAEGVRIARNEPWFRKIVSFATRLLVFFKAKKLPRDANTPLRFYRPKALEFLLSVISSEAITPNLLISAYSRIYRIEILEFRITYLKGRGEFPEGATWGAGKKIFPSKRFLNFCIRAMKEWFLF